MNDKTLAYTEVILCLENEALNAKKLGFEPQVWHQLLVTAQFVRDRFLGIRKNIDWDEWDDVDY
jgi:hypothetical protein